MNTNEYIEKHSKIEFNKGKSTLELHICVPLTSEDEKKWLINEHEVVEYLSSNKKFKNLSILERGPTIVSNHPKGLVTKWVFIVGNKKETTKIKVTKKEV